jgi:hypothetical protein
MTRILMNFAAISFFALAAMGAALAQVAPNSSCDTSKPGWELCIFAQSGNGN